MFFNIFKKKKLLFHGRGGMTFRYQDCEYLIDSEMSFDKNVDIVIYKDSIQFTDRTKSISEEQKTEVLSSLLDYLKNEEGLKVKLA